MTDASTLFDLALTAHRGEEHDEALTLVGKLLERDPNHAGAWHIKASSISALATLSDLRTKGVMAACEKAIACGADKEDVLAVAKEHCKKAIVAIRDYRYRNCGPPGEPDNEGLAQVVSWSSEVLELFLWTDSQHGAPDVMFLRHGTVIAASAGEPDIEAALARRVREVEPSFKAVGEQSSCFPAGTLVSTPQGRVPIETLRMGQRILGSDRATAGRVLAVVRHRPVQRQMVTIHTAFGRVTSTGNHKFLSPQGMLRADDVRVDSYLVTSSGVSRVIRTDTASVACPVFDILATGGPWFAAGFAVRNTLNHWVSFLRCSTIARLEEVPAP